MFGYRLGSAYTTAHGTMAAVAYYFSCCHSVYPHSSCHVPEVCATHTASTETTLWQAGTRWYVLCFAV